MCIEVVSDLYQNTSSQIGLADGPTDTTVTLNNAVVKIVKEATRHPTEDKWLPYYKSTMNISIAHRRKDVLESPWAASVGRMKPMRSKAFL